MTNRAEPGARQSRSVSSAHERDKLIGPTPADFIMASGSNLPHNKGRTHDCILPFEIKNQPLPKPGRPHMRRYPALRWFDLLGFRTRFHQGDYAYVEREGAGVRVLEWRADDDTPFPPHRGFSIYIDVADVDAIVAE